MTTSSPPTPKPQTAFRVAMLLAISLLAGLGFNSVSPLGVNFNSDPGGAAGPPPPLYDNATLGLQVELEVPLNLPANPLTPATHSAVLDWPQAKLLQSQGKVTLVDARSAVFFQTEHIPGAVSLPADSTAADLTAFAESHPKSSALVVYCGSPDCPLAEQLAHLLSSRFGYTNVSLMPGGFAEYRLAESGKAKAQ
jgi:rhodanese-related sulfurtransferase